MAKIVEKTLKFVMLISCKSFITSENYTVRIFEPYDLEAENTIRSLPDSFALEAEKDLKKFKKT